MSTTVFSESFVAGILARALNRARHADERIDLSLLPIGDGLTLARKR